VSSATAGCRCGRCGRRWPPSRSGARVAALQERHHVPGGSGWRHVGESGCLRAPSRPVAGWACATGSPISVLAARELTYMNVGIASPRTAPAPPPPPAAQPAPWPRSRRASPPRSRGGGELLVTAARLTEPVGWAPLCGAAVTPPASPRVLRRDDRRRAVAHRAAEDHLGAVQRPGAFAWSSAGRRSRWRAHALHREPGVGGHHPLNQRHRLKKVPFSPAGVSPALGFGGDVVGGLHVHRRCR